jgi:hypothetical protein
MCVNAACLTVAVCSPTALCVFAHCMSRTRYVDPVRHYSVALAIKLDMSCHILTHHRNYFQYPTNLVLITIRLSPMSVCPSGHHTEFFSKRYVAKEVQIQNGSFIDRIS